MLSQLSRVKAEGRLALLSASVAEVEIFLHDAMKQAEEELERERPLSEHRKSTEDFSVTTTWLSAKCEQHTRGLSWFGPRLFQRW